LTVAKLQNKTTHYIMPVIFETYLPFCHRRKSPVDKKKENIMT